MKKYDAIVVLGRGIRKDGSLPDCAVESAREAVSLWKKRIAPYIVFSGKWSYSLDFIPPKTESVAMAELAMSMGVDKEHLLIEDKSEATIVNICNIKTQILIPKNWKKILVLSIYPLEARMRINLEMALGQDYLFDFYEINYHFPKDKEEQLEKSEKEKLAGEVPEFFSDITPGDDQAIVAKAANGEKQRKDLLNTLDIKWGSGNKLAVLLPGYLDSKDYQHLKILAEDLNNIGFSVARFNPTGSWDNGSAERYCLTQYLKDIEAVIRHAEWEQNKLFDQVVLIGHSFGGQTAAVYASSHNEIAAVVGIMPAPSFESTAGSKEVIDKWQRNGVRLSKRDLPEDSKKSVIFSVPASFLDDRHEYKTYELIKNYHKPILFIAGGTDEVVLPEIVKEFYRQANDPKEYIELPGISHDYRKSIKDIKTVNGKIIDFLLKLNKN